MLKGTEWAITIRVLGLVTAIIVDRDVRLMGVSTP